MGTRNWRPRDIQDYIGRVIKERRKRMKPLGWSQKALADRIGLPEVRQSTISAWEHGHGRWQTAEWIANALGLELYQLVRIAQRMRVVEMAGRTPEKNDGQ